MAIFVQLVTFSSNRGSFDGLKDSVTINEYLSILQRRGAIIKSVTPAIGGKMEAIAAVYVITYEADEPIEFK